MKYKKKKLMLNEMQSFYLLFKFGLVLIYILKLYRKKSSLIFSRKNMFNSLLAFSSFKYHVPSQFLKDFSVENLDTTPALFSRNFLLRSIYLELLIIGVVFYIYHT